MEELEKEKHQFERRYEQKRTEIDFLKDELERYRSKDGRSIDVAFLHASPEWVNGK